MTPISAWGSSSATQNDGGKLKHEEKGCGALAGWQYETWSSETSYVMFNLHTLIRGGCVERAIRSVGGPDGLKCEGMGFFEGFLQEDDNGLLGMDPTVKTAGVRLEMNVVDGGSGQGEAKAAEVHHSPTGMPATTVATASMLPLAVPRMLRLRLEPSLYCSILCIRILTAETPSRRRYARTYFFFIHIMCVLNQ